jgi:hypothetical protein
MRKGKWILRKGIVLEHSYNRTITLILEDLNEGECVDEKFMRLVEFQNENGKIERQYCLMCKKQLYEAWDRISKSYTGHQWKCECQKNNDLVLMVG